MTRLLRALPRVLAVLTSRRSLALVFLAGLWSWWLWVPPRPIFSWERTGLGHPGYPYTLTNDGRTIVLERIVRGGCLPGVHGPTGVLDAFTGRDRLTDGDRFDGVYVRGIAPDGSWLTIDFEKPGTSVVLSTADASELVRFTHSPLGGDVRRWHTAVIPDGSGLALWNAESGEVRWWNAVPGTARPPVPPASMLVFSPDGSRMASVDRSAKATTDADDVTRMIRVWDMVTHREIARHDVPEWTYPVFSPNGRRLVWLVHPRGNDSGRRQPTPLQLWDLADGTSPTTVGEIPESLGWGGLQFSPDGRWLAAQGADGAHFWDMAESPPRAWTGIRYPAKPALGSYHLEQLPVFSPQGGRIVLPGAGDSVVLCDTPDVTRGAVCRFRQSERFPILKFAPDGQTLAIMTGYDRPTFNPIEQLCRQYLGVPAWSSRLFCVQLFDAKSGAERACWTLRGDDCRPIAFSPDGRILWTRSHRADSVVIQGWDVAQVGPPMWLLGVTIVGLLLVVADWWRGRRHKVCKLRAT